MKRVLAFGVSLMLSAVLALPASAAGSGVQTMTMTVKDQVISFPNVPPLCSSPLGIVTITYNGVFHITIQPDGTFSDTGTTTGSVSLTPFDPTQPSFSGHIEDWFNDHGVITAFGPGGVPFSGTDTTHSVMNVHAVGSDGSKFDAHSDFKGTFAFVNGVPVPLEIQFNKASC